MKGKAPTVTNPRKPTTWQLANRSLPLGQRTLVMAVLNITPDSFSDGGLYLNPDSAIAHALHLLDSGADILDLGAESTRPGSHAGDPAAALVSADEEQARLLPVIEGILQARPSAILSVDTYKSATARTALAAGAAILNDVSGFHWDPEMPAVCARARCGVVLMHTRGRPDQWPTQPPLAPEAIIPDILSGLTTSISLATQAGIAPSAIVLDPGYGFGKRLDSNFSLLRRQSDILDLGHPLLVGLSRKSFLTQALQQAGFPATSTPLEDASIAALTAAILSGASIVRVHQPGPARAAAAIADAVLNAQ